MRSARPSLGMHLFDKVFPGKSFLESDRHLDQLSLVLSQVKSTLSIVMQAVGMWYV